MSNKTARLLGSLPFFVAVAEELSFSKAADRLSITQPPLSRRIRNLEDMLGVRLFERSKHHVKLTEAGEALLARARNLMADGSRALLEIQGIESGATGKLSIGFISSTVYRVLPEVVRKFSMEHPGITLLLHEATSISQLNLLKTGVIEVGLVRAPVLDRTLATTVLLQERMFAALPAGHRLTSRQSVSLSELRNDRFIMYSGREVRRMRHSILEWCAALGFEPIIAQEATQVATITSFVSAGLGIALVPQIARLEAAGVVYVPLEERTLTTSLIAARARDNKSPLIKSFVQIASREAALIN